LKRFFDNSSPLLNPADLVEAFSGRSKKELALPERAIVVFHPGNLKRLVQMTGAEIIDEWSGFRSIYRVPQSGTVITRSYFGGPNIAALVEELGAFGVKEFVLCGHCGAISNTLRIGDVIVSKGALREDGASHHYLDDQEDIVCSEWAEKWLSPAREKGFHEGLIWSCDAIYRETANKIERYGKQGILAVEMEVASLYAVCAFRKLKGVAFLAVSDIFYNGTWKGGFRARALKKADQGLTDFLLEKVVR